MGVCITTIVNFTGMRYAMSDVILTPIILSTGVISMSEQAQNKLNKLKKTGKLLKTLTTITSLLVVVLLVFYLLLPAGNLYLAGSDSKYGRPNGYNYYGWQLTFYGCGYPPVSALAMLENSALLAGDYIPTAVDFYPNNTLMTALIVPIAAMIILGIVAAKMKNRGKAVCEFIMAGVLVFAGVMIANCVNLAIPMATNMGTTPFKNSYLAPAVQAGTFTTCIFPIIICAALIAIAVFKACRGGFLIYQRSYAKSVKQ